MSFAMPSGIHKETEFQIAWNTNVYERRRLAKRISDLIKIFKSNYQKNQMPRTIKIAIQSDRI